MTRRADPLLLDRIYSEAIENFRHQSRLRKAEGKPALASYLDRRCRSLDNARKGLIRKRIRDSVPRPDT